MPDLDLPNMRARVISKGEAIEWVYWQTGAAMLTPRLLAGRDRGPVFLADRLSRRKKRWPVSMAGCCTNCGTANSRTSAESGTNTRRCWPRSRHASVRSLERYARPGPGSRRPARRHKRSGC